MVDFLKKPDRLYPVMTTTKNNIIKTMKKINHKTMVTLKNDFNHESLYWDGTSQFYKKGSVHDANNVDKRGLHIVNDLGKKLVIPHDYLGKYEESWTDVDNDGAKIKCKKDVTKNWLTKWQKV